MNQEYYENLEGVANTIHRCYHTAHYCDTPKSPEERKRKAADCRALLLQFLNKWFLPVCEEVATDDFDVPWAGAIEKINRDIQEELQKKFQEMMREKFGHLIK